MLDPNEDFDANEIDLTDPDGWKIFLEQWEKRVYYKQFALSGFPKGQALNVWFLAQIMFRLDELIANGSKDS